MRATLKVLGSTLSQVVRQVETSRGVSSVPRSARVLAASLALAAAAGVHANEYADAGNAPVTPGSTASLSAAADAAATKASEARNGIARVGGGIIGALVGNKLAGNASTLWKTAATLGGAFVGQAAGNALVPGESSTAGVAAPQARPLSLGQSKYDSAVTASFSPVTAAVNGRSHVLPSEIHARLADLMVNMAASRLVATKALQDRDEKELASAASPRDARGVAALRTADRTYQQAFGVYAQNHHDAWNVINLAKQKGFDVAAQRTVMESVPADLRAAPSHPMDWPGVAVKAADMGERAGFVMNYAEMNDQAAAVATAAPRERQR